MTSLKEYTPTPSASLPGPRRGVDTTPMPWDRPLAVTASTVSACAGASLMPSALSIAAKTPLLVQVAPLTASTSTCEPAATMACWSVSIATPPMAGVSSAPVSIRPTILPSSTVSSALMGPPKPSASPVSTSAMHEAAITASIASASTSASMVLPQNPFFM